MGLLGKFGGKSKQDSQDNSTKKSAKKEKRVGKGKKKKTLTLLERMQLEESVAASSLEVLQELVDIGGSAIREVDDGIMIIAITNDMLEQAGLDPSSEEFGSFAEALRAEIVESIALAEDLANGVVGIIPSEETLTALDEFDFAHDIAFHWAIVPFDLTDEDKLTVLDSTVHIERLVEMVNDPSIQLEVRNGEVIEVADESGYEDSFDEMEEDNFDQGIEEDEEEFDEGIEEEELDAGEFDDNELDVGDFDEEELDIGDFEEDVLDVDDFDEDELDVGDYEEELDAGDYNYEEELDAGYADDDSDELEVDVPIGYDTVDEGMTAEETKEAINRIVNHGFNNTELDLQIDMAKFDDYFDSITIAQFDTTRQDDSELQTVLSKLRQDANVELSRFHQDNVQALRNKFTTSMRDIHNRLVESLDHKDQTTTYGSRHYEIETEYEDGMDDLERRVAASVGHINKEYNERREEYGENAKREALALYDSRYRDERNRKIDSVKDNLLTDLKTVRDTELGELYKDRRTVAQRLFDKATTALLQQLQEEYQEISQSELHMYDLFRKDMDVYLRKHFADEVLRAKAEAEKLKQSHEADRVRKEYEQMLNTKTRQIQEADDNAKLAIQKLEATHKDQLKSVKADYDRHIEREQKDNETLRQLLKESNSANSKIGEQKDLEIQHRLKLYEDTIAAKDLELKYANDRAAKSQKPMKFILVASAAVALALGVILGFLFGAGQTQQQITPAATDQTEDQSTGMIDLVPSNQLTHKDATV